MKKLLLSLILFSFAFIVSAAQVYEPIQTWYTNEQNQGKGLGSYYYLKFNADTKLYLLDYVNNIYSDWQNETLKKMGITDYGYYDINDPTHTLHSFSIDDAKNVTSFDGFDFNGGTDHYDRKAYYLGDFKKGAEIEIYLTDGTTSVSSNTPVNGAYTSRYMARPDKINADIPVAQLFMYNSTGYEVNFGLYAISDTIPITETTAMGSPLPTPSTTILIACGLISLAYLYKRKKGAVL